MNCFKPFVKMIPIHPLWKTSELHLFGVLIETLEQTKYEAIWNEFDLNWIFKLVTHAMLMMNMMQKHKQQEQIILKGLVFILGLLQNAPPWRNRAPRFLGRKEKVGILLTKIFFGRPCCLFIRMMRPLHRSEERRVGKECRL